MSKSCNMKPMNALQKAADIHKKVMLNKTNNTTSNVVTPLSEKISYIIQLPAMEVMNTITAYAHFRAALAFISINIFSPSLLR